MLNFKAYDPIPYSFGELAPIPSLCAGISFRQSPAPTALRELKSGSNFCGAKVGNYSFWWDRIFVGVQSQKVKCHISCHVDNITRSTGPQEQNGPPILTAAVRIERAKTR